MNSRTMAVSPREMRAQPRVSLLDLHQHLKAKAAACREAEKENS